MLHLLTLNSLVANKSNFFLRRSFALFAKNVALKQYTGSPRRRGKEGKEQTLIENLLAPT